MNRFIVVLSLVLAACGDTRKATIEAARRRVSEEVAEGRTIVGPLTIKEIDSSFRDSSTAQELGISVKSGKFVFFVPSMGKIETGVEIHSDGTRVTFEDEHEAVAIVSGKAPIVVYLGHFGRKPNKALVPTTTAVTPAAYAPVAPAAVAAHL